MLADLREFMDSQFEGGADGEVAHDAIVAYVTTVQRGTFAAVVEALGVRGRLQEEFMQILRHHFSVETCATLYMHGNLTQAGYQAISNIMAGIWDNVIEKFIRLVAPDGKTPIPRLVSLRMLMDYFSECDKELGLASVHMGQGGVLNLVVILKAQVEYLLDGATEEQIPKKIPVQLAVDADGWHKKPTVVSR